MNYKERHTLLANIWEAHACIKAGKVAQGVKALEDADALLCEIWLTHDGGQRPRGLPGHTLIEAVTHFGDHVRSIRADQMYWRYVDGAEQVARYRVLS